MALSDAPEETLFKALRNAHEAGDESAAKRFAEAIKVKRSSDEWTSEAPLREKEIPKEDSDSMLRDLAMGTSDVVKGASALPSMLYDVAALPVNLGIKGINLGRESLGRELLPYIPSGQEYVRRGIEAVGLPEAPEGVASAVRQGLAGGLGSYGLGALIPAAKGAAALAVPAARSGLSAIREALMATPAAQAIGGGASAASSEAAKEIGLGPTGQILAGLLGGTAGGYGATKLGTALDVKRPIVMVEGAPVPTSGEESMLEKFGHYFETPRKAIAPLLTTTEARVVPSSEDLKKAATDAYAKAKNSGALFKPDAFKQFADDLTTSLVDEGLDEDLTRRSYQVLNRIQEQADAGQPLTLDAMDRLRKVARRAYTPTDPQDSRMASIIKDKLDDFVFNATPNDLITDDPAAFSALKDARRLYFRKSRGEEFDEMSRRADLSASEQATAIRAELRSLAKNKNRMKAFSPEERAMIEEAVKMPTGAWRQKFASLGRSATGKLVSMIAGAGTGAMAGIDPVTSAATALALEKAAQMSANRAAGKQYQAISEFMRTGKAPPTTTEDIIQRAPQYLPGVVMGTRSEEEEQ